MTRFEFVAGVLGTAASLVALAGFVLVLYRGLQAERRRDPIPVIKERIR